MMRKSIQIIAGIIIAGASLWMFVHLEQKQKVDFTHFWNEIVTTPWWVLLTVGLLSPLSLWFRSLRWGFILPETKLSSRRGLFSIATVGFMFNNILPARMGEVARAFILWRNNGFTPAESIGSLVIERLIDLLALSAFFFIPVFLLPELHAFFAIAVLFAVIFLAGILFLVLYACFPLAVRRLGNAALPLVPAGIRSKVAKISNEVVSNLDWVLSPRRAAGVVLYTVLTMACYPLMMLLLVGEWRSFGFLDGMFSQAFAAGGAAIPFAPGYVGTLHFMVLKVLTILSVPADKAGAVAVLYHGLSYIVVTILGLYFFFRTHISLRDIEHARADMDAKDQAVSKVNGTRSP